MTKRRKSSRGAFDFASYSEARGFHRGTTGSASVNGGAYFAGAYTMQPYYPSAYHPVYNGYLNSGYGTWYSNAYGAEGFQYMRGYDPSYDAFYTEGPTVDEKWRSTYPYVPTSYLHQNARDRSQLGSRSRGRGGADTSEITDTEDGSNGRDFWGSQLEFFFSAFGLSAGISAVLNFTMVAHNHGRVAFLIPYAILSIFIGLPLYLMEVTLGQFAQLGPLQVWKEMLPFGIGVGVSMTVLSLIYSLHYTVIMGYSSYYIFASFVEKLPWTANCSANDLNCNSSRDYWENYVLNISQAPSSEMENGKKMVFPNADVGEIKWDLSLTLLLSWIVVFITLSRSVRSLGKIMYVSATLPYAILITLLIWSLQLEDANSRVMKFFEPDWDKLYDVPTWSAASHQLFISMSLSFGGLITYGSYNKFSDKAHYTALLMPLLNLGISVMACVVFYAALNMESLSPKNSLELAFVSFTGAALQVEIPQLWTVLFCLMIFLMGLNGVAAAIQTILTALYDFFGISRRGYQTLVSLIVCCICYLLSIPCVSFSGQYVFDLMEKYGLGLSIFWVAIFESTVIMWIYGVKRFADDLKFMLEHFHLAIVWKSLWALAPLFLVALLALLCYSWEAPSYHKTIEYPQWAHGVGLFLTLVVAIQIPIVALVSMIYYATKKNFKQTFQPTQNWGPGDSLAKQEWVNFQYNKAMRCKQHPYGYDNYAMNYSLPYYNNAFHM